MPPTPHETVPELASVISQLNLRSVGVLRRTDKTLLATAELAGEAVVVKLLLDDGGFWATKWRHEIDVYRTFADNPPPVRVPRLVHTDGQRLLVLERLDARPLDTDRYPRRRLTDNDIDVVIATLHELAAWRPPAETFAPVFDYPDRVRRYHTAGYLSDADRDALHQLLHRCGDQWQLNHGDPVPSNLLLTRGGGCALIDWEFTGLYLPGFDLAMVHTLVGPANPAVTHRIDEFVVDTAIARPFAVNLAMVMTRELRIHRELPDSPTRRERLQTLNSAWVRGRDLLHATASDKGA
ncbi:MAG: phosphotransferase [Stackebrandtia sp.]